MNDDIDLKQWVSYFESYKNSQGKIDCVKFPDFIKEALGFDEEGIGPFDEPTDDTMI